MLKHAPCGIASVLRHCMRTDRIIPGIEEGRKHVLHLIYPLAFQDVLAFPAAYHLRARGTGCGTEVSDHTLFNCDERRQGQLGDRIGLSGSDFPVIGIRLANRRDYDLVDDLVIPQSGFL